MKKRKSIFNQLKQTRLGFNDSRKKYFDRMVEAKLSKAYKADQPIKSSNLKTQTPITSEIELSTQGGDFISTQNGDNLIIQ